MGMFTKDCEIVEADKVTPEYVGLTTKGKAKQSKANEAREQAEYNKRCKVDKGNSYATEKILRDNFNKEWKANPGNRHELVRKYQKKG